MGPTFQFKESLRPALLSDDPLVLAPVQPWLKMHRLLDPRKSSEPVDPRLIQEQDAGFSCDRLSLS